jgi:hypothetical protein
MRQKLTKESGKIMNKTTDNDEQIDEILDGFGQWMVDSYCESMGTKKVGGIGNPLKPSEAKAKLSTLLLNARIETANWAIHYTDKIEQQNPAPDDMWRTFKFIRNGMREEFEKVYGVDPSPKYDPKSAELEHQLTLKKGNV